MRMLYFAWVREGIGTGEERVTPPAAATTVAALLDWLVEREPYASVLADRQRLRARRSTGCSPVSTRRSWGRARWRSFRR